MHSRRYSRIAAIAVGIAFLYAALPAAAQPRASEFSAHPLTPLPALTSIAQAPPAPASPPAQPPLYQKIVYPSQFYLHDGDRVVFFGDSITAQQMYTTDVETYCVTRFPTEHFEFVNAGWGWDKVSGGPGGTIETRLVRDVFAHNPTVISICLGSNDAGIKPFDQEDFEVFAAGYRHLLDLIRAKAPDARLTLISPPTYDDYSRSPKFPGGTNEVLKRYSVLVKALADEYNATYVDCNTSLRWFIQAAVQLNPSLAQNILPDRIHPREAGQLVIATTILRAWNAPAVANIVTLDAAAGTGSGTGDVTNLQTSASGVTFTMTPSAIPWPIERDFDKHPDMEFLLAVTNTERDFNKYRMTVTGLAKPAYHLFIDGTDIGVFSRDQFESGIQLADLPTPNSIQSDDVFSAAHTRNDAAFRLWHLAVGKPMVVNSVADTDPAPLTAQLKTATDAESSASQPTAHHYELIAEEGVVGK